MKILIGSGNPGKIEGAKKAFSNFFDNVDIEGIPVSSGVPDEPVDKEIYLGASNRVNNLIKYAYEHNISADYYLGVESGLASTLGRPIIINIAVIKDSKNYESWGTSSGFPVPDKYVEDIKINDLGHVMDRIFKSHDLRSQKGGINHLTKGVISRIDLTEEAFIMALTQFINEDLWHD